MSTVINYAGGRPSSPLRTIAWDGLNGFTTALLNRLQELDTGLKRTTPNYQTATNLKQNEAQSARAGFTHKAGS